MMTAPSRSFFRSVTLLSALALLLVSCLCGLSAAARAATDQTAKIKSIFTEILDRQVQNAAKAGDQRKLQFDGEVTVERVDDYYAVTLPRMSVLYPGGERLEVGMVSVNVTSPESAGALKPGQWKMTVALPTPIPGFDKNGVEIMRVSLASQRAAGIWDEALGNFVKLDAKYSGLKIDFPASRGHIAVPSISILYNLAEGSDKRLSGPLSFEFLQPEWDIPVTETKGRIARLALKMELQRFAADYLKKTNGFLPEKLDFSNPEFLQAGDGMKLSLAAKDADFSTPALPASGLRKSSIKLKDGTFDLSVANVLSGVADVSVDLSFSDFGVAPSPAPGTDAAGDVTALIPAQGRVRITHDNIPVTGIVQAMANNSGPNAQMAGLAMMLKLPALFSQAGSLLTVEESTIGNDRYRIDLDGRAKADIAAALSATAEGKLSFAGLDEVIAILKAAPPRYQSRPDFVAGLNSARSFLEGLKQRGKAQTSSTPPTPVYDYDFKLEPSGIFTVNGAGAVPVVPLSQPKAVPPARVSP